MGYSGITGASPPLSLNAGQSANVALSNGAGAGVYGAWTTLLTTSEAIKGFWLVVTFTGYLASDRLAFKLALGQGGAEVLLHGPLTFVAAAGPSGILQMFFPFEIPAARRIAAAVVNATSATALVGTFSISTVKV